MIGTTERKLKKNIYKLKSIYRTFLLAVNTNTDSNNA
jgi:hypothetical protein